MLHARQATCFFATALLLLTAGACSSHPTRIDAWPIYYHDEIGDKKTTDILWPIGGSRTESTNSIAGAWPLVTVRGDTSPYSADQYSLHSIFPFFVHRKDKASDKTWVLPFYLRTNKLMADGRRNIDHMIFPLFWWGTSPPEEKYFAFFPFYGTIRSRLARDEIFFVMFPIYGRSKLKGHVANNVLFPLIAWTYGGDRRSSRVLPFYSRFKVAGEPEIWSILWPFIHFSRSTGEERLPRNYFYFFPLLGWDRTMTQHKWTALWPFFSGGTKPGTDYYQWIGPWPIVRFQKDRGLLRRQIWPFYGYLYQYKGTTRYIMWPVYRHYYKDTEKFRQREWFILYLLQNKIYYDKITGQEQIRRMFWPFFRYFKKGDGSKHFMAFSLLWYWNERGFERNYSRFWRIFEYVKNPDADETSWRFVWRLIRYDRVKNYRTFNVLGPLFRYEHEDDVQTRYTILGGLLSVGKRGGAPVFKLLYIPFASGAEPKEAGASSR
ncbi:MAG: hypothetical protein HQ592_07680 [Planctomycetes bacterium]|nr:hypothetical protein [Planctomycetota bacterium]